MFQIAQSTAVSTVRDLRWRLVELHNLDNLFEVEVSFLIGTDEAGYGPNLGPLTVTGTLWKTEDVSTDLYQALTESVRQSRVKKGEGIFIADSKRVYSSGAIGELETSVLSVLFSLNGRIPETWVELLEMISPAEFIDRIPDQTWLSGRELELPLKSEPERIKRLAGAFQAECANASVELLEIQCAAIFPPQFNSQVEVLGNKATLLSAETLKIVQRMMAKTDDDLEIGCDKHGGRSKYSALLQQYLTEEFVIVGEESLEASDYSFRESGRDVVVRFQAKGESFLPTALSSLVSKYLREVFMRLWNDFWQLQIPGLKPTKGYPVDAKRFKSDIAKVQAELGIADRLIWRNR